MALPELAYRLIGRFSVTRFDRALHPFLYRLSGGRGITGRVLGSNQILLTTTGRRSGRPRTVALFAYPTDGGWIVVASRGGSGRVPDWAHNLEWESLATVRDRRATVRVRARELAGDEYEAAFELAAGVYPGYRLYRRNARHHIPIFRLESVESVYSGVPVVPAVAVAPVAPPGALTGSGAAPGAAGAALEAAEADAEGAAT